MRLLKILLLLFVILGLAVILSQNSDQIVNIWLMPGRVYENVSLSTTMVSTIAIGILLGFIIGLLQILEHQRTIGTQNKQLKKLRTEINNLRHSGLDEAVFEVTEKGGTSGEDLPPPDDSHLQLEK
ncbi:MAG: LapA family protein [Candidatus Neomarinimicrobiota bacterium]